VSALRSLHARLAALLLGLLLVLGAGLLVGLLHGSRHYSEEVQFRLSRDLAAHVAESVRPFAGEQVDRAELKALFMHAMVINPSLEIYLLDRKGELLAYDAPEERILRRRVDLEPVQRLLASDGMRTVRGDDPRSPDGRKPISAAPVVVDGEPRGWIYIILGGQDYESVLAGLRQSWILRSAAVLLAGALLVTGIVGLFALGVLTRPLRRLRRRVAAFRTGRGAQSIEAPPEDELAALERAFAALERRIEEQVEALRTNDERRREFVAGISHDLRTPAAAVQGWLEALQAGDGLDLEERERCIEVALRQCKRLSALVDRLFELARLEAQEGVPRRERFSLAELVQDIVCELQPAAQARGVFLRARFPTDLPAVAADIGLVERALDNLIDNALRHTPSGGEVAVTLRCQPASVEVSVHDTGSGIPLDEQPRLFERFVRVEREGCDPGRGAGLGLAITRRIVELHGGSLTVDSRPDAGATFAFSLMSAQGDEGADVRESEAGVISA